MPQPPKWEVATVYLPQNFFSAKRSVPDEAKELLADGWEPFAVEGPCMWFRRQIAP